MNEDCKAYDKENEHDYGFGYCWKHMRIVVNCSNCEDYMRRD